MTASRGMANRAPSRCTPGRRGRVVRHRRGREPGGGRRRADRGTGRVTRSDTGIGLLDEQVDQRPAGLVVAGVLERAAGPGEVGGGLGERRAGPARPRPRRRAQAMARPRPSSGDRGRAMPGQVGGLDGATAGVAVLERVGDPLVQRHPLRDLEPAGRSSRGTGRARAGCARRRDRGPAHRPARPPRPARATVAASMARTPRPSTSGNSVVARHRGRLDQLPALGGQPSHAAGDEVLHGRRYRARGPGRIGQQLGELAGEERVPGGAPVHLGGPALGRVAPDERRRRARTPRRRTARAAAPTRPRAASLGQYPGGVGASSSCR